MTVLVTKNKANNTTCSVQEYTYKNALIHL